MSARRDMAFGRFRITDEGELMLDKRGMEVAYDDSLYVKVSARNRTAIMKKTTREGSRKNDTYVNGDILHKAVLKFIDDFGDYTAEEEYTEMEFTLHVTDAKFILMMSRKKGFVNFLIDWYLKQEEEKIKNE